MWFRFCGRVVYNFMSLFTPLFSFPDQIFVLQHFPNCKAARIIKLSFTHSMARRSCSALLNGESFCPKTISGNGGYPPPLNGKSAKLFRKFFSLKGLKMMFFSLNKVKNGPKRPYNGPKRAKISVFWPKIAVFSGFSP